MQQCKQFRWIATVLLDFSDSMVRSILPRLARRARLLDPFSWNTKKALASGEVPLYFSFLAFHLGNSSQDFYIPWETLSDRLPKLVSIAPHPTPLRLRNSEQSHVGSGTTRPPLAAAGWCHCDAPKGGFGHYTHVTCNMQQKRFSHVQ